MSFMPQHSLKVAEPAKLKEDYEARTDRFYKKQKLVDLICQL